MQPVTSIYPASKFLGSPVKDLFPFDSASRATMPITVPAAKESEYLSFKKIHHKENYHMTPICIKQIVHIKIFYFSIL